MSKYNHPNLNIVLERFKKGEITISHAFNLLTNLNEEKSKEKCEIEFLQEIKIDDNKKCEETETLDNALDEMDKLIGLDKVKDVIREFIAYIKVQNIRKQYGLKTQPVVMHMIFKGNPGTGKTTIARKIGKIFNKLNYLKSGELIEADRADLVGEYIGHTAQKTKKIIHKALGGVLFIDEAYSLARGGEKDFGREAIDTMVKAMEDYKDNLIIILAGYREEMKYFLDSNPGLRSRFSIQIDFPNYTIDELVAIADMMFKEREYILDKQSKHYIYRVLTFLRNQEGNNNGNARTVRNLVEKSIRQHSRRILKSGMINYKNLITIKKEDLAGEVVLDDRLSSNWYA